MILCLRLLSTQNAFEAQTAKPSAARSQRLCLRPPRPLSWAAIVVVEPTVRWCGQPHRRNPPRLILAEQLGRRAAARRALVLAASVSIFAIVGEGFAGGRVDEMLSAARKAIHQLIVLAMLCRFIGQPALHAQAGIGAAVKKQPFRVTQSGQDRSREGA